MFFKRFSFGMNKVEGYLNVLSQHKYNEEKGYGFVSFYAPFATSTERVMESGSWYPRQGYLNEVEDSELTDNSYGIELEKSGYPLRFRASVPEAGVYSVSLTIKGGNEELKNLNIYTGRRNLVRRDINIAKEEKFTCEFMVHVCDYISEMGKPPKNDLSIHIAITGDKARLSSVIIEKAEAPTLFIAGDSIVADYDAAYPYNPLINGGAWGQYILQYLDGVAVNNQAHGGMTTNCFRDDGHWDIICKRIRPGDIFMFQFGHNDQKRRNLAPFTGYSANLRWYLQKIRSMGAVPVMVTSLSRIPSKDEYGYYDLLEDHAEACRRVGRELKVHVIDLHQHSFEVFCNMDDHKIKGYFNDAAHTNDYGALMMAEFIAKEIKSQNIEPLSKHIVDYFPEPWVPDESLRPLKAENPINKPERPILSTEMINLPYVDCVNIRQLDGLKEAMARGLLDPCLKFFHPFDDMPRGQFFFLFFKAAQAPEKRVYQGKYCDIYRYEWDASFIQAAIDANLIDETTTPNDRFRPDEGLTGGELLSIIVRNLHEPGDRNFNMDQCEQQAKSLGIVWEGYSRNTKVNRIDCVLALVHMLKVTEEQKKALPRKSY